MQSIISRWFMFGLLVGWALTHATVFAQETGKSTNKAPAAAIDKLRANLDKNITIDYTGQSLTEVLNHFREKAGVPINVDQMALLQMGVDALPGGGPMPQVEVKATNEKASQVLRKLLNSHQLTFIISEDAVLVTTEESAVVRQMRQRVSVNVEDVAFKKAVRDLAKNHGVNLVIDPKVAKEAETAVTLQLEDTGIETAVRLLSELASLKSVRMGNVLFVTNETKAAKIRKEEPAPVENPFGPQMMPMIRGGLIGGFGGGMMGGAAMPGGVGGRPVPVQKLLPGVGGPPPGVGIPAVPGIAPQAPPPPPKLVNPVVPPPVVNPPPVIERGVDPNNPPPRRSSRDK